MKIVLQVAVALLLMAGVANAQTPTTLAVDLNRAYFSWSWEQGTGGMADYFTIKCVKG